MNARFRIGNKYQFDRSGAFISSKPLRYLGYAQGTYRFIEPIGGYMQVCPKEWLEDKEVGVINEWGKDGSLKVRE